VQRHLEQVGATFIRGYREALFEDRPVALGRRLDDVPRAERGFAFEGAAMGLALLDLLSPWSRGRLRAFLDGPGAPHVYMVHVGAGWALAQLGRSVDGFLARLDPVLRWLVVDGYGFHAGYFRWTRYVAQQARAEALRGYALRAFDQGLGRSLWFVEGADAGRIAGRISLFAESRRPDLWSGVGLAASYAGGRGTPDLQALRAAAWPHQPHLAQGAAFAAKARERAGNPVAHTAWACQVLCGVSASEAARAADAALAAALADRCGGEMGPVAAGDEPVYEVWRRETRARLAPEAAE
jgi:hypothetical protein